MAVIADNILKKRSLSGGRAHRARRESGYRPDISAVEVDAELHELRERLWGKFTTWYVQESSLANREESLIVQTKRLLLDANLHEITLVGCGNNIDLSGFTREESCVLSRCEFQATVSLTNLRVDDSYVRAMDAYIQIASKDAVYQPSFHADVFIHVKDGGFLELL